jgi:hypothetical protein
MRINERGADHRQHRSSIIARVRLEMNYSGFQASSHNILLFGFCSERQSETVSKRYDSDHITYTKHVIIAN